MRTNQQRAPHHAADLRRPFTASTCPTDSMKFRVCYARPTLNNKLESFYEKQAREEKEKKTFQVGDPCNVFFPAADGWVESTVTNVSDDSQSVCVCAEINGGLEERWVTIVSSELQRVGVDARGGGERHGHSAAVDDPDCENTEEGGWRPKLTAVEKDTARRVLMRAPRARTLAQVKELVDWCEKRHFLRHLCIKTNLLPRQARDKHRGNQKRVPFSYRTYHVDVFHGLTLKQRRKICEYRT